MRARAILTPRVRFASGGQRCRRRSRTTRSRAPWRPPSATRRTSRAPSRCTATRRAGATCACISTARRCRRRSRCCSARAASRPARTSSAAARPAPSCRSSTSAAGSRRTASRSRRCTPTARARTACSCSRTSATRRSGRRSRPSRRAREPLFADAVDLLARLQVAGARDPDAGCVAFGRRFDGALARAELEHFVDHGIETRHGTTLPRRERARRCSRRSRRCEQPFVDGPFVLSHRDYMAWNLHVQRRTRSA